MFYIMRHGQTEWNRIHKLQGQTDIPLNDNGREMARNAKEEYKDVHFDVCYCSPLVRAKETADLVLEGRDIPIIYDDRLMEMNFGEYEGAENTFADENHPINIVFKKPEEYTESVGGSETFEELFSRTGEFLRDIVYPLLEEGKDVLVVAHGAMNLSIVSQIKDLPRERFWEPSIDNCKLMRLI